MKHFSSFFGQPKHFLSTLALLGLTLGAHAEGSKNLTPGTGTRGVATGSNNFVGYLQHDDGANSNSFLKAGSPADQRLYIRLKANETLYYGVRRVRSNDVDNQFLQLELKYLGGANGATILQATTPAILTPQAQGTVEQPNLAANQAGVIATPEQAAAGPRYPGGPATGYSPLTYTNTTGADRDFWIEFTEVRRQGGGFRATDPQTKSWYDIWDFTVRDDRSGTVNPGEKTGRLYSQHWSFTAAGGTNQLSDNFKLFSLIPNPNFNNENFFIKRVSYSGIQPFGVILVANSQGTTVAGDFKEKRKSRPTNIGYPEYKLFVNNPDPSLYPTTVRPGTPTVTTTCASGTTTFNLNVDQSGFGIIFIDGNSNSQYEPANDRVLEQNTLKGDNAFVWNGLSDTGAKINATTLKVTFSSGVGPVNFPIWDCEQAPVNGISVQDVRPGNNGATDYIFWDDSPLGTDFITPPTTPPTPLVNPIGNNTEVSGHRWGADEGNEELVNSYAVGLLARGNEIIIQYDAAATCATAPVIELEVPLPVELSSFTARFQNASVLVNWETASEKDCAYFLVERGTDGKNFTSLGQVAGNGTTSSRHRYAFTDVAPLPGLAYYRLRQVDTDGTAHNSPVVAVKSPIRMGEAVLYPNPATTGVTVRFADAIQGPVNLRIVDATGRILWKEHRTLEAQTSVLDIPTAQLPTAGFYLLQVTGNGFGGTYRFTK